MAESGIIAREQSFKDVDFSFRANPVTGDVALKKDEQAVRQSVMNIILTNRGEKPFDPDFGSNITSQLFENFDPIIEAILDEQIRTAVQNYEPRAEIISVKVSGTDENSMNIDVAFRIVSPSQTETAISLTVKRFR